MTVSNYLRTIDLAQAGQISVQQVRNYEAAGFIPLAGRSPGGYRLYTPKHLAALKNVRSLVGGYGWQRVREIMQSVHQGNLPLALALIDERHAELAAKRLHFKQTLAALRLLAAQSTPPPITRPTQRFRIGEAAGQVGVRVSALHFWEQQGLLQPIRDKNSRYRLYDELQMRRLRVVVLLREAGYDFNAIHVTLDELEAGQPEKAIAAVEKRWAELTRTSWECLTALSSFQGYISEYWPELCSSL
jgi:DNA-binding transcriptional MerR regulator